MTHKSSTAGKNHHDKQGNQQQQQQTANQNGNNGNQRNPTPKRGRGGGHGHRHEKGNGGPYQNHHQNAPPLSLLDTSVPPPPTLYGQPPPCLFAVPPPGYPPMNVPPPLQMKQIQRHHKVDNFPINAPTCRLEGGFEIKFAEQQKPKALLVTVIKLGSNGPLFVLSAILHENAGEVAKREAVRELIELIKQQQTEHSRVDPMNKASLPFLKDHFIVPLEKAPESFPDAVYYCEQCDYHISNILHARLHLDPAQDARHSDIKMRTTMREEVCRSFPALLPNQLTAIEKVLTEASSPETPEEGAEPFSLAAFATEMREKLLEIINKIPILEGKTVILEQYGSVPLGLDLPHSDVNYSLDVLGIDDSDSMDVISSIHDTLKEFQANAGAIRHHDILLSDGAFPRISFTLNATSDRSVNFVLSWKRQESVKFTRLVSLYLYHQPKLVELIRLVRKWARICCMFGSPTGLNKHAFDLMVIHFLQQKNKLTILHELQIFIVEADSLLTKEFTDKVKNMVGVSKTPFNIAELFVEFFKYYSEHRNEVVQIVQQAPLLKKETKWNNKVFQVSEPIRNENIVSFSKHFQPFFFNCILLTFIYFAVPRNKDGPLVETNVYQKLQESPRKKRKRDREAKENGGNAVRALGTDQQTPGKMEAHEKRWKAEGKREGEDAAEFVIKKADEALTESTKKRKHRRRSKKREAMDSEEEVEDTLEETVEVEEREPLTLKDFPNLIFDRRPLSKLEPKDYDVDDTVLLQYSRRTMFRLQHYVEPFHFTDEMRSSIAYCAEFLLDREAKVFDATTAECESRETINSANPMAEEETPKKNDAEPGVPSGIWGANGADDDIVEKAKKKILQSPQTCLVPTVNSITTHFEDLTVDSSIDHTVAEDDDGEESSALPDDFVFPSKATDKASSTLDEASTQEDEKESDSSTERICFEEFFVTLDDAKIVQELMEKAEAWSPEDYDYSFDRLENYTRGYMPDVKCQHCDSNKHDSDSCPQMKVPDIEEISYVRPESEWKEMDEMIQAYYQKAKVNDERRTRIMKYLKKIERNLAEKLPGARLEVFGSLMNGFGGANSDADICFRFASDTAPPDSDPKEVVKTINETLKVKMRNIFCQAILGAKVPIVKFTAKVDRDLSFEGDISFYNTLALSNTRMLKAYTEWAPERLPQLGLWVKNWAKACDIGDASKGSLSSYSYIIMMIHYLQNCEPPVLPRLQEDFKTAETEKEEHGDWDVYFHKEVEKGWSKNKQSVAQLFVGFLDYFSRFEYKTQVIQIRRKKPLLRAEKKWNRSINLEDPFDLRHNLGSGVTAKMFVFILKSIRISRSVFMKPMDKEWLDNLSAEILKACRAGNAPADRQCHRCHRVGHIADACPNKLIDRDRKMYGKDKYGSANRNRREADGEQHHQQQWRGERRDSIGGRTPDRWRNGAPWRQGTGMMDWTTAWDGFKNSGGRRHGGGRREWREFDRRDYREQDRNEMSSTPQPPSREAYSPKPDLC